MKTDAVYMIGNGRMAAAFCKGDMVQMFGPPYSSPSLFVSSFVPQPRVRGTAHHLPRSAVWQVELPEEKASVTDFALPEEVCLVRHVESAGPLCLRLSPQRTGADFHYESLVRHGDGQTDILVKMRNGLPIYNDYPLPFPQFFTILTRGGAQVTQPQPFVYDITVCGTADILLIGGPSYPECDRRTQRLRAIPYEQLLQRTLQWWEALFADLTYEKSVPQQLPQRERLLLAVEDTVLNLTVQQSQEGGVLAGYPYHLGYVRDQFGVCMAMLRLGMYAQAKRMLQFYLNVFRQNGCIRNAQAMGVQGLFHFAENDDTEITGYLLLQFFRYAQVTGDVRLLLDNTDFLLWLYDRQAAQLHNGMLPFNGDETYIAGGLLPRDVINEGSAEATMLFLLSGRALLEFLRQYHLAKLGTLARMRGALEETEAAYASHFVREGRYTLNAPERLENLQQPPYRYGVCMNLGQGNCDFFGWTQLCEGGVYLCPLCRRAGAVPKRLQQSYYLPSALLMPAYLDAYLLDRSLVVEYLQQLVQRLKTEGHIYSDEKRHKNVGYDYGLLLCNLVRHGVEGAELVCDKLLQQLDEVGAWSEYYIDDQPSGARYRPWESAINIDALLGYAGSWQEKQKTREE